MAAEPFGPWPAELVGTSNHKALLPPRVPQPGRKADLKTVLEHAADELSPDNRMSDGFKRFLWEIASTLKDKPRFASMERPIDAFQRIRGDRHWQDVQWGEIKNSIPEELWEHLMEKFVSTYALYH